MRILCAVILWAIAEAVTFYACAWLVFVEGSAPAAQLATLNLWAVILIVAMPLELFLLMVSLVWMAWPRRSNARTAGVKA